MLKVTHITASLSGGAGIAATRLHRALRDSGIDSSILTAKGSHGDVDNVVEYRNRITKFRHPLLYLERKCLDSIVRISGVRGRPVEIFSPDWAYDDISNHEIVRNADVVNLHWVAGYLDHSTFFRKVKKPIVWTLHDMNPFFGGLHYSFELARFPDLDFMNEFIRTRKRRILRSKDISVVCLNQWMLNESKASGVLSKYPHYIIQNGAPTPKLLSDSERVDVKRKFGFSEKKRIVAFVSESLTNYRKGFDVIMDALHFGRLNNFQFVAIGKGKGKVFPDEVRSVGFLNEGEVFDILQISDATVLTSRQDNLPNVLLESLMSGTPVIAYPVGGIKEVLKDLKNGIYLEDCSSDALIRALARFNELCFDRYRIAEDAAQSFSLSTQARRYIELYTSILEPR